MSIPLYETRFDPDDESYGEEAYYCHICEAECERVSCWKCGGAGGKDGDNLMQEDPLWYDEDDWEDCDICDGQGSWWQCPNERNHAPAPSASAPKDGDA